MRRSLPTQPRRRFATLELLETRIAPANVAFAISGGNGLGQRIVDMGVDAAGNSYVAGTFEGTVDFDPSAQVVNRTAEAGNSDALFGDQYTRGDVFVAKYTGAGALAWVDVISTEHTGGDQAARRVELTVSPSGDVFVYNDFGPTGNTVVQFFEGGSTTTPTPQSLVQGASPGLALYLAKIDTSGHFLWAQQFSGTNNSDLKHRDVTTDGAGGIYIAGDINGAAVAGTVTFGATTVTAEAGDDNLFVVKLQDGPAPTVIWASALTSPVAANFDSSRLAVDRVTGAVSIAGTFAGSATFATPVPTTLTTPAPNPNDQFEIFVAQLDSAGAWQFADLIDNGTVGSETTPGVAVDGLGNTYVAAAFGGVPDFDPGPGVAGTASLGTQDAFLLKLDATGAFVRAQQFGGASGEDSALPQVTPDGHVHFGVIYAGALDLDAGAGVFTLPSKSSSTLAVIEEDAAGNFISALGVDATRTTAGSGLFVDNDKGGGGSFTFDSAGGLHVAGAFVHSFGLASGLDKTTLASRGGADFFVARYFPGDLVAQDLQQPVLAESFSLGAAGDQGGGPIIVDAAGNLYLAGIFTGTVDFNRGPGVTALTSSDPNGNVFIAKYDALGALQWVQPVKTRFAFIGSDGPSIHLGVDNAGEVFVACEFGVSATLGPFTVNNSDPLPTGGTRDVLIAKLAPDGTPQWLKSIGSTAQDEFVDGFAVRGATGDVVFGGEFTGTVDFNPAGGAPRTAANVSGGTDDSYIVELATDGSFKWVRQLSGAGAEISLKSLGFLSTGDVAAAGTFQGTVDFNFATGAPALLPSTPASAGEGAAYVARFDALTGSVVWSDGFGGFTNQEFAVNLAVGAADELFVAGQFTGAQDFDPGVGKTILIESGGGEGAAFLQKLDASGTLLGAVGFGATGGGAFAVALDGAGGVYVLGKMGGGVIDLDPSPGLARLAQTQKTDGTLLVAGFDSSSLGLLSGYEIPAYNSQGQTGNKGPGLDQSFAGGFCVDAAGDTFFSGGFTGTVDLDPAGSLAPLVSKGAHDIVVLKFSPSNIFDAAHPRTFHDANGDVVSLKLSGPGTATYALIGAAGDLADLAQLDLSGTTAASTVTVTVQQFGSGTGATTVQKILTADAGQSLGSLSLAPKVTLGDGLADGTTDLRVSGALKTLTLGDIAANATIRLGEDLPYDNADPTVADTKNHAPTVGIGNVLGPGVELVLLAKDTLLTGPNAGHGLTQGIGGGGLGNVTIGSWSFPGFIRTTQSIGNVLVQRDDFYGAFEVDKFHVGATTTAGLGNLTISQGAWGSSGNDVEGGVKSFNAEAFLAGAAISAGSIGPVTTKQGEFGGALTLTDDAARSFPIFTVTTDFVGSVVSASAIKRLNIKGTFSGSLEAPSIGAISAFAFIGTMGVTHLEATHGSVGLLTSRSGPIKDYEIISSLGFGGATVLLKQRNRDTVALDNVKITAATIGNITVNLAADPLWSDVDLVGVLNSTFTATAIGATVKAAGKIGNVSVTLTGVKADGSATGILNSTFDAQVLADELGPGTAASTVNSLGSITVKISGSGGTSLGLSGAVFRGDTIGATTVTVSRNPLNHASIASDAFGTEYTATRSIGALTFAGNASFAQVTGLQVIAGGTVGAVTVKATTPANGQLLNSAIAAGQALVAMPGLADKAQQALLNTATLGAVTVSGALTNTTLAAGSRIGAVAVGGAVTDSLILAGVNLGGDLLLSGNETYQRAAGIASITVKGTLSRTTIAAGIDAHAGGFGDGDDAVAGAFGTLSTSGGIGALKLAPGTSAIAAARHHFAIEGAIIASVKLGTTPALTDFTIPLYLRGVSANEDMDDILLRLLQV
jgi:hypothetical protein